MRTISIILIFLSFTIMACSTMPKDSKEPLEQYNVAKSLMELGHEYTDSFALESAHSAYEKALNAYAVLDNREGVVHALLALGGNRYATGALNDAEEYFFHAEALARNGEDATLLLNVFNHQAEMALKEGDPLKAMSILTHFPIGTQGRTSIVQIRLLATAYYAIGREKEAVDLLLDAAKLAEAAGEHIEAAQIYYKQASIASLGARFDEAIKWSKMALEADKMAESGSGIAADLRALTIITQKAGDLVAAEDFARRAWLAWKGLGMTQEAEEALRWLEELSGRMVKVR